MALRRLRLIARLFGGPERINMRLRLSGIIATIAFLILAVSDLLMLTTLDFSRPYRFWSEAAGLPQEQVVLGYFMGLLTAPFICVGAWHLAQAIRPPRRWVGWLVVLTIAYSEFLLMVFHASFAFTRSILRVQADRPGGEAEWAFNTLGWPMFRIAVWVGAPAAVAVIVLILVGKSHYPRWAGLVLPSLAVLFVFPPVAHLPVWAKAVLGAARYNLGGAVVFALSTVLLWNRDE